MDCRKHCVLEDGHSRRSHLNRSQLSKSFQEPVETLTWPRTSSYFKHCEEELLSLSMIVYIQAINLFNNMLQENPISHSDVKLFAITPFPIPAQNQCWLHSILSSAIPS